MAVSGRKPEALSLRTGSNASHPSSAAGTLTSVERPDELSEEGGRAWDLVAPDLVSLKLLRESDVPLVIELCEALGLSAFYRTRLEGNKAELREVEAEISAAVAAGDLKLEDTLRARETRLVSALKRNSSGWRDAVGIAARLAGELGLGPVSRIRTGIASSGVVSLVEGLQMAAGVYPN